MNTKQTAPGAGRLSPNAILALVSVPIFIGALDLTVISAVLPALMADLGIPAQTGLNDAAWMVSGYLLAYTISMTFMGRVSDIWGRQRVLLLGLAIFMLGSIWVALAPGWPAQLVQWLLRRTLHLRPDSGFLKLYVLIAGRVVQAFGAGALVPVSMALIGDVFPAQQRAVPLGIIAGVDTAGWVLGHLYGGVMVQYFAWPVLFWLNVPLAGAALLVLARWLPAGRPQPAGMRFDWGGALLVSLMLVALNLGLNTGADAAPGSSMPTVAAAFSPGWLLVAGGALLAFVLVEWRSAQPLLNLGAFRKRAFSAATLLNLLLGFCLMVGLVSVPLYINTVTTIMQRLEPQRAALLTGYLLSAFTLPMALAAIGGGWVAQRAGNRAAALLGCALGAAGLLAMSRWQVQHSAAIHALFTQGPRGLLGQAQLQQGAAFVAGSLLLAGSGLGLTLAPITTTVVDAVPEGERGSAAALVIIMRLIGMSVSVSAMTTYGLERSHALLLAGTAGMQLADFAAQVQVLVNSTTQVIDEMALIAALVCALALPIAAALQRRTAPGTAE
ncbi:MAG: hypothetical protein RL334_709 [Chloroflexota bacterium]